MDEIDEMRELAKQLRCPAGEWAEEVGENMFVSNSNMIFRTIDRLAVENDNSVLEIGFGNGKHLPYLLDKAQNIGYNGIDISEAMVIAARANNVYYINEGNVSFHLVDGSGRLPFPDQRFDCIFTVNTIYFWEDVLFQLREIYRALKSGGRIVIASIDKTFGEQLPFTQTGFAFYEKEELMKFLSEAGFQRIETKFYTEETISKAGEKVTRPYLVISARS